VAKIYPLLSFDSPLEYSPEKTISMASHYVHITGSLEKPLLEFFPLQHTSNEKLPRMDAAASTTNTSKVWLPS
jgi:hypothetical protein